MIQSVSKFLQDYTIPSVSITGEMPHFMHAQAALGSPTTRTTNLPYGATLSQKLGRESPDRPRLKTTIHKWVGKSPLDCTPQSLDMKHTHQANTADMPDPSEWGVPVQPNLAPTNPSATLPTGSSPTVPTWHLGENYLQLPGFMDPVDDFNT